MRRSLGISAREGVPGWDFGQRMNIGKPVEHHSETPGTNTCTMILSTGFDGT